MIFESEVSSSFTKFYHKKRYVEKNEDSKNMEINLGYYIKAIRLTFLKPSSFIFLFISKFRFFLWKLVSIVLDDKSEIYKSDVSNFWIMDNMTIERMLDYCGFKVEKKIQTFLSSRVTYIVRKVADIDPTYGSISRYSIYKKRVSNIKKFSKS